MKLTEAKQAIIQRPIYGEPEVYVFGQVMGTLSIDSRAQLRLLTSVLERGMLEFAGRHEETFLAKLHRDLVNMDRRATAENWAGWGQTAGLAAAKGDGT